MKVEVVDNHQCEKPLMPKVKVAEKVERLTWYGKKYVVEVTNEEYAYREARFTCHCGAKWRWSAEADYGYWLCDHRPQQWKQVEL